MRTLAVFDSSEDITSFVQGKIRVRPYKSVFLFIKESLSGIVKHNPLKCLCDKDILIHVKPSCYHYSRKMTHVFTWPLAYRNPSMFNVLGSHCWGRKNIPGVGRRPRKVPRSTSEVWEVVWAATRGKAGHILLVQLLERQGALPRLALPQHKLPVLLFVPAGSWGWAISLPFGLNNVYWW